MLVIWIMFVAGTRNQWDSEAKIKAHVHCVIIGFSIAPYNKPKKIFIDERYQIAKNINGYLLDAANVYVESRNKLLQLLQLMVLML